MKVVVGMSGGVDSSVAAYLLKEAGHEVVGLFMKNWEEDEECPAALDYDDVVAVCDRIGIPHYVVNFAQEYWDAVFAECLKEYEAGFTPNPDILCNREIKFKVLLEKALDLGAEALATGHYCRKLAGPRLGRGLDENKDQSYFLYTMKQEILERVLFPIGEMRKPAVRALAEEAGLVTAGKKDSTGICFVGKRNFREFLSQYIPKKRGKIERLNGEVVGEHEGIAYYTLGQRKGLGIGGEGEPWFIVGKDVERNVLLAEQGEDHPALWSEGLVANEVSWVGEAPELPLRCTAKIRYRSPDVACEIVREEGERVWVKFDEPQKAVTPRQSIVFYDGEVCLGGAMIISRQPIERLLQS